MGYYGNGPVHPVDVRFLYVFTLVLLLLNLYTKLALNFSKHMLKILTYNYFQIKGKNEFPTWWKMTFKKWRRSVNKHIYLPKLCLRGQDTPQGRLMSSAVEIKLTESFCYTWNEASVYYSHSLRFW